VLYKFYYSLTVSKVSESYTVTCSAWQ